MAESGFNPKLKWKVGFIASSGKYLTSDGFGSKIHASSLEMKKKQIFTIDPFAEFVHLIAPNGKYLSAGQKGELEASKSSAGKEEEWTIEALDDGKWAIKSSFGYYLGHQDETVHSFGRGYTAGSDKVNDPETAKWTVHLAIHPQVVIRNNNRSSYIHLEGENLNCNEAIAWGVDALITMGYVAGKYSLQACNGLYLNSAGTLSAEVTDDCKFILVIKEGEVAFKTSKGKYLQSSGSTGKVHAKQNEITKNELFQLEDSHPQVTLKNLKYFVTWKQGTDVKCVHEDAATDKEIWQMEIDRDAKDIGGRWSFRNNEGGYVTMSANGELSTSQKQARDSNSWMTIEWHGSAIAMKAHNGKYVCRLPNGQLKASMDSADDSCKFTFGLINRPQLVLRSPFGYLAAKSVQGKSLVQCASPIGDVFLTEVNAGQYAFKNKIGDYWKLESDGSVSVSGSSPEWFYIQLMVHTHLALKAAATQKFFHAEQSGAWKACSNSVGENELLEY